MILADLQIWMATTQTTFCGELVVVLLCMDWSGGIRWELGRGDGSMDGSSRMGILSSSPHPALVSSCNAMIILSCNTMT